MDRSQWLDDASAENPSELLWEDSERKFCRVWRDDADGVTQAFIAVSAAREHGGPSTTDRFVHEHALKDYIDGEWALRPRELVRAGGNTFLLLDYRAGEPLDRMLGTPLACERFLRLAIAARTGSPGYQARKHLRRLRR